MWVISAGDWTRRPLDRNPRAATAWGKRPLLWDEGCRRAINHPVGPSPRGGWPWGGGGGYSGRSCIGCGGWSWKLRGFCLSSVSCRRRGLLPACRAVPGGRRSVTDVKSIFDCFLTTDSLVGTGKMDVHTPFIHRPLALGLQMRL